VPAFPIFLDLGGRGCLVVGGGSVGCAKAKRLMEAGAEVLVVDPAPSPALKELALSGFPLRLEARAFRPEDCDSRLLVFACTDDPAVNASVAAAASARRVLCCRADAVSATSPEDQRGNFTSGAVLRRGALCVAVTSGGAAPGLAAAVRDRIATVIGEEFGEAAEMLSGLREGLAAGDAADLSDAAGRLDAAGRSKALRDVLAAGLVELLREGRRNEAAALVDRAIAAARSGREEIPCTR
jgi:precorrin-2 dehydrogenase/sirohydrochlorin ferrochelatase